jgi:hypothetical protein
MSRTTPNLGLTVWSDPNDQFSTTQLAQNWDKLDADYIRGRPANSAELLSAVPVSGNFDGRLVYLTAADSGFAAKSLIRYNGSSWAVVGYETLSALPTSSNFAGRLVLLSASASGFPAWTLVRYDGSTWAQAVKGVDIAASVPLTNNYAGRVVVLSAADSGFSAWDVIRFDGSSWAKIGPQPIPPSTRIVETLITTDQTTTSTSDPGTTLFTFASGTYENVQYYFHMSIPQISHSVASSTISIRLRDSTPANVGNPTVLQTSATAGRRSSHNIFFPFSPTAGSHTYAVTWWSDTTGTVTLSSTGQAPAVFRIIKS